MMENFPNLMRKKSHPNQGNTESPKKRNPKRPTLRHIIITMAKEKAENLKGSKGKTGSNIKGSPNKTSSCFLNGNAPSQ